MKLKILLSFNFLLYSGILNAFSGQLELSFIATTNIPGLTIEGKLNTPLKFKIQENQSLSIPIAELTSELELRDRHMREEIFSNKDIIIKFLKNVSCQSNFCRVEVQININNTQKNITLTSQKKSSQKYFGNANIPLSDFNIARPSKFGVSVENLVKVDYVITVNKK